MSALQLALLLALAATACSATPVGKHRHGPGSGEASALAIDEARTRQFGQGPAFRPAALRNPSAAAGQPVDGLRCRRRAGKPYGAHIELFARGRGIAVPPGIGIARPQRHRGALVLGGRCLYPLRTVDPTGVIEVSERAGAGVPTVGQLFALWGEPLSSRRLAGFMARPGTGVVAFVDGRKWLGDPRRIPLSRHAAVVLELDTRVQPHPYYLFPGGL